MQFLDEFSEQERTALVVALAKRAHKDALVLQVMQEAGVSEEHARACFHGEAN